MLHTRLCDLLGIKHPIISAPMAGGSGADLAAAVSAAGGLGMIGASFASPDWLREQIELVRQRIDKPFGGGFVSSAPDTEALMDVALEYRVPVISHAFADPTATSRRQPVLGLKTMVQVQTVAQAAPPQRPARMSSRRRAPRPAATPATSFDPAAGAGRDRRRWRHPGRRGRWHRGRARAGGGAAAGRQRGPGSARASSPASSR